MTVVKLPQAQLQLLRGQVCKQGSLFNPIRDRDGNWIISMEEMTEPEFAPLWDGVLKDITVEFIEYKPINRQGI